MFVLLCVLSLLSGIHAQKSSINSDWQFVRLAGVSDVWEIHNQGTDWESQFNVQVSEGGTSSSLSIPDSVLKQEQRQLQSAVWEPVRLPHTAYVEPLVILHPWQGICYYKRQIKINNDACSGRVWIEFEGAMQLADIWINGQHAAQHAGGFTSFVVDATDFVHEGNNELLVRLDNRDNKLIPPGKPLSALDFCYHSGLYRDVNLIIKKDAFITHPLLADKVAGGGVFVAFPKVNTRQATMTVQTDIENSSGHDRNLTVRQTLFDWTAKGKGKALLCQGTELQLAAKDEKTVRQQVEVERPRLWYPDDPQLYMLRTELIEDGQIVDVEETRVGIRRLEITLDRGLVVNGRSYRMEGSNRHQEYPYAGNALSDRAQYRDMYQIRDNGFNTVRLGHYPQDPSVLDACDELGLLAIEPIPGWQFYSSDSLFQALTFKNIKELIRRDRNHPSIVMWETTLNESWPPQEWKGEAVRTAHAEMPGDQCFTSGDSYGYNGFDVCYNDWDDATFTRPNLSGKPCFIREYYDYEFGGHYSTSRIRRADGQKALVQNLWNAQWSDNAYRGYFPGTMGAAVWSMYDYNRGCCDNICYSGVADLFRLPKFSLSYYRIQTPARAYTPGGPMKHELFAATYWEPTECDTVLVYGNVDEVELKINGRKVARKKADKGATTAYKKQPDCGNCLNLRFPPFTFTGITWQAGVLEIVGYEKGRRVVSKKLRTPETYEKLVVSYFESGKKAARNDLLIFSVELQDKNGTLCPVNDVPVTLQVEGGRIIGPATYCTEAGVASFVVETGNVSRLKVRATSGNMSVRKTFSLQ